MLTFGSKMYITLNEMHSLLILKKKNSTSAFPFSSDARNWTYLSNLSEKQRDERKKDSSSPLFTPVQLA